MGTAGYLFLSSLSSPDWPGKNKQVWFDPPSLYPILPRPAESLNWETDEHHHEHPSSTADQRKCNPKDIQVRLSQAYDCLGVPTSKRCPEYDLFMWPLHLF